MPTSQASTFRALLRHELARRCAHNEQYSLRAFARQLDIDAATLSQLLRGRRALTPQAVEHLGRALGLDDSAIAGFAREVATRVGSEERGAAGVGQVAAAIVADPVHHSLLALVSTDDFHAEVKWIARVLDTNVEAIQLAVHRLVHVGLLSLGPGGTWRDLAGASELEPEEFEELVWKRALASLARSSRHPHETEVEQYAGQHGIDRFQIICADPEGAARFYGEVFGWTTTSDNALGVRELDTGNGLRGQLWPAPPDVQGFVQRFVSVRDVSAAVERATRNGATLVVPPQVLPEGDEMAVLRDPQGIPFGVVSGPR